MKLSVIVPTYNEVNNVEPMVAAVSKVLENIDFEIIYVDDDSPDGTAAKVKEIGASNDRVHCVHRIGRRGLSSAVIEGVLVSSAQYVAVIDGDMQHDESKLIKMVKILDQGEVDAVVGSRLSEDGDLGEFSAFRVAGTRFATWLARTVARATLSDPMSGFFMLRRSKFEETRPHLSGIGFKILLDIFASAPTPISFSEVGFTFRTRTEGESKMDAIVVWEYLMMLWDKRFGRFIPSRFASFSFVGGLGVFVHMGLLALFFKGIDAPFALSQALATFGAMTGNFYLNNVLTYRDKRLQGKALFKGLLSFYVVCGMGAIANVGVANAVFLNNVFYADSEPWAFAGIVGAVVGVLWNFVLSSRFTWGQKT